MKSVMQHRFSEVPSVQIPRSVFDRTHGHKTTFDVGQLIPFYVDEALPGDTFKLNASVFARMATPIAPIMDNLFLETFYFAVPNRLIWSNWEKFNGAQDDPEDSIDFLVPEVTAPDAPGWAEGSLFDYMGIPINTTINVNALHSRAYNLIWNEWFRDQNIQDSITVDKGDGPDSAANYVVKKRNKKHDYFTSCLPWPQKGDSVTLPIGDSADVWGDGTCLGLKTGDANDEFGLFCDNGLTNYEGMLRGDETLIDDPVGTAAGEDQPSGDSKGIGVVESTDGHSSGLVADLSSATASTINEIREAFQIQKMLEKDARGGTRYVELLRTHFGVVSPDFRLQRPEYLGGSSCRININPVQQTSSTDATTPQGNLAAFATAADQGRGFTKSFTEHCVIIGLVNVRADLTYQEGINRMFSRRTRYDYYWPSFAHLGEQAVLQKEIYAADDEGKDTVFGYQERYAEYRYKPSIITGEMRSEAAESLDLWHLSQDFSAAPTLNSAFIEDNTPMSRVLAQGVTGPHFIFDSFIQLHCARPMPVYSVPGLVDHF